MPAKQALPYFNRGGDVFIRAYFVIPGEKLPVDQMQPSVMLTNMKGPAEAPERRLSWQGNVLIFELVSKNDANAFIADEIKIGFNVSITERQFFSFFPFQG